MSTKLLVLSIVGAVVVAAAAAGGYSALRSNPANPAPAASQVPMAPGDTTATVDPVPVAEAPAREQASAPRLTEPRMTTPAERAPARLQARAPRPAASSPESSPVPA